MLEKNEKEQQFLSFIKASFQGYWPIFIRASKSSELSLAKSCIYAIFLYFYWISYPRIHLCPSYSGDNSQMAVWDRIDFLRITAKPLNFFVALTREMAGDMNFVPYGSYK